MKHVTTGTLTRASLLACASLCAVSSVHAANQTWSGTPADALWATATNWVGGAAPGTAAGGYTNATRNADVATFNAAVGTIASAADPVQTDLNRFLKGVTFDTAAAGSHVIGVSAGNQLQLDQGGAVQLTATVENPQRVNADIRVRAQSSFNPTYSLRNNATLSTATLTVGGVLQIASSTGRGVNWSLEGTNTGDNLFNGTFSTAAGAGSGGFTALTKTGTGTWRVTGTNTLPSVAVNNGLLITDNAAALGAGPASVSGGTLSFGNFVLGNSVVNLSGTGTVSTTGTSGIARVSVSNAAPSTPALTTASASDVLNIGTGANSVTDGQAASVLSVTGPGTVSLNAAGTYVGTWSVNSGVLLSAVAGSLGNAPSVTFGSASTGILRLNGWNTTIAGLSSSATPGTATVENASAFPITLTANPAADVSFHGLIQDGGSGSLALTKGGAGTLTLASANTYTGGTIISGGTLLVTNTSGSATGSGTVTVKAGGTLGGTGMVDGDVIVESGGKLDPGASLGTTTVGSLDLDAGSTLEIEFNSVPANDLITVDDPGGLTIDGGAITLLQEGTTIAFATPGTYNLIAYSGTLNGTAASLTVANPQPGFGYTFDTNGSHVTLTIATTGAIRTWTSLAGGSWTDSGNWNGSFPTAQGDSANFITDLTGGPVTITLDGNKTVGGVTFNSPSNSYTIAQGSGGTLTLDNGSNGSSLLNGAGVHFLNIPITLVSDTLVSADHLADVLTLGGAVDGAGKLTKTGPGSISLLSANSFLGDLSLSGGSTRFVSGGLGGGDLILADAKLLWEPGNTQDISDRAVTFSSGTIELGTGDNDVLLANAVGGFGTANLVKSGSGRLTLAANAQYTGSFTIAGGTLQLGTGGATGSLPGDIVNNGALVVNLSADSSITGSITGTGSLDHNGTATLSLSGANTYSGNTRIGNAAGTLKLINSLALQGSTLLYPLTGGTLSFDANTAATLGALQGDKDLDLTNTAAGGVALTVGGNGASSLYSGKLTGAGSLAKAGAGVLTLTNINSYAGATNLNGVTYPAINTLDLPLGGSIATTAINTGTSTLLLVSGGQLVASAEAIIDNRGYSQVSGFQITSGSAAFNGGIRTTANDGCLIWVAGGSFSASSVTLQRTRNYNALAAGPSSNSLTYAEIDAAVVDGFVVSGGSANISGPLVIGTSNSGASAMFTGGSTTVAGTVTVGNTTNNRWSLLQVSGGTFTSTDNTDGTGGILLSPSAATANRAMLKLTGGVTTAERIGFGSATAVAGTGVVWLKGGTLYLGAGGMQQVPAAFTSTLRLTAGTLAASADWSTTLATELDGTITLKAADASDTARNITLGGSVAGTGSVIKTGAGTVTLAAAHSYAGNTDVTAGTLVLSAATLSDTGTVNVASGAVLNLQHGQIDTVAAFSINGLDQGPGTFTSANTGGLVTGGSLYVAPSDPFLGWIDDFAVGSLDGKSDDADGDGLTNLEEFALDSDPSAASASAKVRARVETVGAEQALVITLPVRDGAIFGGTTAKSATIDGIVYTIRGSNDLADFDQVVTEITASTASTAGLPAPLGTGWTYRSFRLSGAIGGGTPRGPKGFLDLNLEAAP